MFNLEDSVRNIDYPELTGKIFGSMLGKHYKLSDDRQNQIWNLLYPGWNSEGAVVYFIGTEEPVRPLSEERLATLKRMGLCEDDIEYNSIHKINQFATPACNLELVPQ